MTDHPHLLGIDVGTTGSKALLIDAAGAVVAAVTTEYPLLSPRPGWAEQDPDLWWSATAQSIRSVIERSGVESSSIAAVGLTGQMHGLVALDGSMKVLRAAILWNDQRTAAQCEAIHERIGLEHVMRITGKPALTGFTAPKVLWMREEEPDLYARIHHAMLPKDYVRLQLTGELATDVADASGTSLFNVAKRDWSDDMLGGLDIPRSWWPNVTESPVVSAKVSAAGASATGLALGTPVVAGAGDQAAEAVGVGLVAEGAVSVTIGTSGVLFAPFDDYRCDEDGLLHGYCHAIPGMYHVMGVMLSAGGSLRWFRDALCQDEIAQARSRDVDPYDIIIANAATAPAGCEGLIFLPYLTGERTPHADPNARGAFIGLSLRHDKSHMARAVLEGITFGLLDSVNLLRDRGLTINEILASGGGTRSSFWRQMLADAFHADVVTVNATQGAAFGAAILAGVGAELYPSVPEAARAILKETGRTNPGPDAAAYAEIYPRFRALYPTLREEFTAIANVVEQMHTR